MRHLPKKVAVLLRTFAAAHRPAALLAVALAAVAAGLIWQTASPQVARYDAEGSVTQARDAIPEVSHPPFRQLWSFDAAHQVDSFVVTEDTILFGTFQSYGAVSLKTGAVLWEKSFPEEYFGAEVAYDGTALYVAIGGLKLLACEPKTGRELWSTPIGVGESEIAVSGGTVVCETQPGVLAGVDAGTGRQRWAVKLSATLMTESGKPDLRLPATPLISAGRMFLGTFSGEVLCLEPQEGALLWRRAVTTRGAWISGLAADGERLYCTTEAGELIALDRSDGEARWHFTAEGRIYQKPAVFGDLVLVGAQDGVLYVVDSATGRRRWTAALSRRMEPGTSAPTVHAGQILVTAEATVFAFSNSGKALWSWDTEGDPLFGYPVTVLNDGLLLADAAGFRRFAMGEPPALPATVTERQTLAQQLVGRFDTLSQEERRTLARLGGEAFAVLLPMARERLQRYEAAASVTGSAGGQARREAYQRYTEAMEVLAKVATKEQTPEMLALLGLAKTEVGWTGILQWLADKGDERQTIPLFLDILEREKPDWNDAYSRANVALSAVSRSRDPGAVHFLIQRLADPEAHPQVRHEAYVNLARTGGAAGLEAVLAAKDTGREIPSLERFLGMDQFVPPLSPGKSTARRHGSAVTKLLALREGEGGISWGLFSSQALGSVEDLWVSERAAGHWSTPIFTGTTQEGLGDADWYSKFAASRALTRDSDGDGFSDLIEERLGTDPHRADSDGDGLIDAQDKNPLAAPRTLSETEQVLSAAFEARFRFLGEGDVPCLVELPQGIEPFEFAGWDWIVIARKAGAKSPLAEVTGKGLAVVSFAAPNYDLTGAAVHGRDRAPFILWNEAHTEAKLEVRTFYGGVDATGYDIHLKKLAGHWVVTEAKMIWIS